MQLSDEQKREFFHQGYVILKGVVSEELVANARARIKAASREDNLSDATELTDLVNRSEVTPILQEVMGQFDPPSHVQVGVTPIRQPGDHFTPLGYQDKELPYYGHTLHAEGLFTGAIPQEPLQGDPAEIYRQILAGSPKGDIGRTADVIGTNTDPLFQDPEMTLAVGSFTTFCIVPLNEQLLEGVGQTAVIPGGHHVLEQFYRWQDEVSGRIGPEGPGWPRFTYDVPNNAGHTYLPEAVQEKLIEISGGQPETTPDGRRWPRPTPIMMEPGDAAFTIFQMPHTGTRNQHGTESRKNMIFRLRNKSRQPNHIVSGISDHPDRGRMGEWLEYEEGNNPWERSRRALTHMWEEWEGMTEIVATEQAPEYDFSHVDPTPCEAL